jgi:acetoacetyl-CoA synthetase
LDTPLWQPGPARVAAANLTRFREVVEERWGRALGDYATLHRWSVGHPEEFWPSLWDFAGVIAETRGETVLRDGDRLPGAAWFPDARLNYAENLLRGRGDGLAVVFRGEDGMRRAMSHDELHALVSRIAAALRAHGIAAGDRVAAYLPNTPEALACMLAAASIGAVWSSCSPDFGVQGVLDRFGQIGPRILFAAEGYRYNGKPVDCRPRVAEVAARLPSLEAVITVPLEPGDVRGDAGVPGAVSLADFLADHPQGAIAFARLPFGHPLCILYSSGTTGAPKCIVHAAGGVLLQHLKEHLLHCDVKPGDRIFYFTTLGWMMWNWLISGLAARTTLLLYDGSPFHPDGNALFDFAGDEAMTHLGVSAKFIDAAKKAGLRPRDTHDLAPLRAVLSTGSPLSAESFDYVYEAIKPDVCLSSISGGTDIVACFVAGNPAAPVWRGEIQAPCLGMDVAVFDDSGQAVLGRKGELVCRNAFPSVPLGFWNDPDGHRFRAAYFGRFPGVWCHGDWAEITDHGGIIIHGRSDAVLNPGGVRIGTAEIYRQVEQVEQVEEALAVGQEWDGDVRIVLFVRLRAGAVLDKALEERIRARIRENASPRHVPARILAVDDIPRTRSGKIVELAVREAIHDRPVRNLEALANPQALGEFRGRPELKS